MALSLCAWFEKTVDGVETYWLSGKEKGSESSTVVSKESHTDSKSATVKSASYSSLIWQYFSLFVQRSV